MPSGCSRPPSSPSTSTSSSAASRPGRGTGRRATRWRRSPPSDGIVFELAWFADRALARRAGSGRGAARGPRVAGVRGAGPPRPALRAAGRRRRGRRAVRGPTCCPCSSPSTRPGRPSRRTATPPSPTARRAAAVRRWSHGPHRDHVEADGRLRALVADVSGGTTTVVGVVSWTLLADGWHALRARQVDGALAVELSRVEPADLAAELAPVLAEVCRRGPRPGSPAGRAPRAVRHPPRRRHDRPRARRRPRGGGHRAREAPGTPVEAADQADSYDRMMRLADLFDDSGEQMRQRAGLGVEIVSDPAFADSAPLSPATHARAEDDVRAATTGKHGLLTRSIELDADALVLRATVLTYRWIDELQAAAYETLGSIAGRAIGYLAPEVALGGAIVSAGLIETDALDRDGVAAYLSELAEQQPRADGARHQRRRRPARRAADALAAHRRRARRRAAAGWPAGRPARRRRRAAPDTDFASALRDVAGGLVQTARRPRPPRRHPHRRRRRPGAPRSWPTLMATLEARVRSVVVRRVGPAATSPTSRPRRRRAAAGCAWSAATTRRTPPRSCARSRTPSAGDDGRPRDAGRLGARAGSPRPRSRRPGRPSAFVVDQVVTAGAPSAQCPGSPTDPGALARGPRRPGRPARLADQRRRRPTGSPSSSTATRRAADSVYVAGGRAADRADHPDLRAEIARLQELGYLAG